MCSEDALKSSQSFVRALKSAADPPNENGPSKIQIARLGWDSPSFYIPRKSDLILEWILTRFHREKSKQRCCTVSSRLKHSSHSSKAREPSSGSRPLVTSPRSPRSSKRPPHRSSHVTYFCTSARSLFHLSISITHSSLSLSSYFGFPTLPRCPMASRRPASRHRPIVRVSLAVPVCH